MTMTTSAVESKVGQLLGVLDEDIRHLETTLGQLDTLRSLLIKRDDAALDQLLGQIRARTETYAANERRRQALRADLALMLACDASRLTLSKLESMLPERQRAAVSTRQEKLKALVTELKREYMLTSVLVSDCSRFNQRLVRAFFGAGGQTGVTYSPSGATRKQTNATLMSLKL
ncbi:MAG: flagellar export chaperone FlgN [Sedimentisphaerales bacterium]|nr:flagellar export chaperone FlgN [Sedimentisphaerales bacterium]